MKTKLKLVSATIALLCAGHTMAADAPAKSNEEKELEVIVVSSDLRKQDLQSATSSISILDAQLLQVREAQHLEEVLNLAPNVNISAGSSRARFIQIRGIGELAQFSDPINQSVGFLVDDLDFSTNIGAGTLFDVAQVEVLRGPHPTAFGASAFAGAVKVKTVEADSAHNGRFTASVAQRGTWTLGGAYGDQISDKLFYRVALHQHKSDGFIDNIYLNRRTNNLDEFTSRLKLKYLVNDDVTLDVNYQYFDIDNGYDAFSLDNNRKTRSDEPGFDRQEIHTLATKLTVEQQWGQLVALASHSKASLDYGFDWDWANTDFHPDVTNADSAYLRERDTNTVELRAISGDNSKIWQGSTDWLFGAFFKQTKEALHELNDYTPGGVFFSDYDPDNIAAYVQTDTKLADKLMLTFGLRYDTFKIDYQDSNNYVEAIDESILGGKVALSYDLNGTNIYASIARGYRAGGFNKDEGVSEQQRIYQAESNWNYEVGTKGSFQGGYYRLAAFFMDRKDTQVRDFDPVVDNEGNIRSFINIIDNADSGESKGIEVELGYKLTEQLDVAFSGGWLDTEFGGYVNTKGELVTTQELAHAPNYTFNVSLAYAITDNINWRIEAEGKDEFRYSNTYEGGAPAFELVNTQLSYDMQDWRVTLWAKNLFDEVYYVRGLGGFNNDPRDPSFLGPYNQLGNGRQLGVSVDYQF